MRATRYHRLNPDRRNPVVRDEDGPIRVNRRPHRSDDERQAIRTSLAGAR
jgi:hypothetical protein